MMANWVLDDMSSTAKKTEAALVCAGREGEGEALRQLLECNWGWLKGLVYSMLGNIDDVDDVLQNVCVVVINKIGTLREPERFRGWLATVARREALAYRQKHSRESMRLDDLPAVQQDDGKALGIDEIAVQNEQYQQILAAVNLLPEKYREVFVLKYMEDMSYAQITEILEIPATTIQVRLVRARRMVHNRLTGKPADKVPRT